MHVLFVCVHNSGRSQMAEAFTQRLGKGDLEAESAGTAPSDQVNPVVIEAMREKGFDLSGKRPKMLTQEMVDRADRIITMGCSIDESCPVTVLEAEDWGLEDPAGKPLEVVRRIRDEIEERARSLVSE